MPTEKTMKVKELQAILAECDPEGEVSMWMPSWISDLDAELGEDDGTDYGLSFVVEPGLSTAAVEANGKPNLVSIRWADEERTRVYQRRVANARDHAAQVEEPEPMEADADHVVVDVLMRRETHAAMRRVAKNANTSEAVKEGACTHGVLTVSSLLGMLAEDVGMVDTRPGSWEGSNMSQVLTSHGYPG